LGENGLDDGLRYDEEDSEKRLAEIFPWWRERKKKEELEEEGEISLEELRRLFLESRRR
jgi:hypothetical protein